MILTYHYTIYLLKLIATISEQLKACVRYFDQIFIFSPNEKVHEVIDCLNKNSITHFV